LAKTRRYWPDGQVATIAHPVSSQPSAAAARVTLVADASWIRCDAKTPQAFGGAIRRRAPQAR
jgi:hypothetical protein